VKLDAQVAAQVVDQRRNRFARIQLLIVHAVQRGAVVAELAAVQITQGSAAQQFDVVTVLHGAAVAEGFQQLFFGFGAGEQVRAVALELQAGELRPVAPDLAAGRASSSIGPGGWPVTSAWPKLRTEAPRGVALRSKTLTLSPRLAAA
jgi:hypothetical protein